MNRQSTGFYGTELICDTVMDMSKGCPCEQYVWVVVMCQCRPADQQMGPQVGMLVVGDCKCVGARVCRLSTYFPSHFAVNLKLLFKKLKK